MKLKDFQLKAINELHKAMESSNSNIILKSPTGSGKTIMLTHFMDEYIKGNSKTVFIWLTPGKGNLEEQSKDKMDKYIHNSQTKLLSDVMTSGFEENDCCFINWEKLTKKGNNALKDSERTNFLEWISKALDKGLIFKVIIDESHQNFTAKSDEIVQYFKTNKIIRCSATPLPDKKAYNIEISEADVISAGLIKKLLVINENFPQVIETTDHTGYLLEAALNKQIELRNLFLNLNKDINPLIIVQLPNNSDALVTNIEAFFETRGINYDNGTLGIWLSNRHENLEYISSNSAKTKAVIIKQAVATGWDCPRTYILVKLRENMDETFEIQTIGRIRRMPEAKHYGNDVLDSCYLYTFDNKFTQGVKSSMGKAALEAKTIFLKNEYKKVTLTKEQRTSVNDTRDPKKALTAIIKYLKDKYSLTNNKDKNKIMMEANGFVFDENIVRHTLSGQTSKLDDLKNSSNFSEIALTEPINTNIHGREYHNKVGRIGLEIGLEYAYMNTIIGKIFGVKYNYHEKIIALPPRNLYAFVINNFDLLRYLCREAMAARLSTLTLDLKYISEKPFTIPQSLLFTYDKDAKVQSVRENNVYNDYLASAEIRSSSEKKFEKYCEESKTIEWIYKNGDKGDEYFSIVYLDNSGRQKLFYPDYIISVEGELWIIETKGGFDRNGNSEDIDLYTGKKFDVLKTYLNKHKLKGGMVRLDKSSDELCICMDKYVDDISSKEWKILKEVIK